MILLMTSDKDLVSELQDSFLFYKTSLFLLDFYLSLFQYMLITTMH